MGQVFNVVWQNTPFHYLIAGIFITALLWEFITVRLYCSSFNVTTDLIRRLQSLTSSGQASLDENASLNKYLKLDAKGHPIKQNGQFVLIQYPSELNQPIPRSDMRFIPMILTAIGILGTFYGIQSGLEGISPELSSSEELLQSSQTLFQGMRTAFSTSLMGLGASGLFTFFLFLLERPKPNRRNSLRRELSKVAFLETPNQIFSQFDFSANRDAAISLKEAAASMAELNPESLGVVIGQHVGTVLNQAIATELTPVFKDIGESLRELRQLKEDQGEKVLESLIQSLRTEVLEPLSDRLDRSTTLTEQASIAVQTLTHDLGGITKSLGESILTIQQFQEDTLGKLSTFAENLKDTLTQFQIETKGVLHETAQELRQGTVDILQHAEDAFGRQSENLESVGRQATNLMDVARENLVSSLNNIDGMLQKTSQMVQGELQLFREQYQASLQTFFEQQNNLLNETLGEQRQGLARVVDTLNTVFQEEYARRKELAQEIDRSMQIIKSAVDAIGKLEIANSMNWEMRLREQQESAREITKSLQESRENLERVYRETHNSLNTYMDHSNQIQIKFFDQADSAMAQVSSRLLDVANVLVAVQRDRQINHGGN